MILNNLYKSYCNQIAKLFCSENINKTICEASTSERLINTFDDNGFSKFLSKLSFGRSYESEFKNYRVDQNTNRRYVDLFLTDVITGQIKKITWNWLMSGNFFTQIQNSLSTYNYEIIQGSPLFDQGNYMYKRILHKNNDPNYGIVFVPGGTPGGGTPGGGTPGGGQIIPTPTQTPNVPVPDAVNFDIKNLLKNPIVLIGIGVVAYFFIIKK